VDRSRAPPASEDGLGGERCDSAREKAEQSPDE
jgi:hypothetical protein